MSIKLTNAVNELRDRVEKLEGAMNVLSQEPRKVAGMPDPDVKRKTPAEKKAS